jgi:hypothetical protein
MNPLITSIKKHTDGSVEEIVKFMILKGIISYTSITHAEIYQTYSSLLEQYTIKKEPKARMKAAYDTSIEHKIALSTVYEIKKEFKDLV